MTNLNEFDFEGWVIIFDPEVKYHSYDDATGYGIQFLINGIKYDLFHNKTLNWSRIFISAGEGNFRDIPFHAGTIELLPDCIKFFKK